MNLVKGICNKEFTECFILFQKFVNFDIAVMMSIPFRDLLFVSDLKGYIVLGISFACL